MSYEYEDTEAPDWNTRRECGGGLHFCAHPALSLCHGAAVEVAA